MDSPGQPAYTDTPPVRRPLTVDRPPHWRASETAGRIFWTTLYAAALTVPAAAAFFGWRALWALGLSIGSVAATEWLFVALAKRPSLARHGGRAHTILMGLLLGLTLPATVSWYVIVLAGVVAVVVGKGVLGGLGHYLWHPVLIGRFVVHVLFFSQLAPAAGPVLDRHHVFLGDLSRTTSERIYDSWLTESTRGGAHAFLRPQPLAPLAEVVSGQADWIALALDRAASGSDAASPPGAVLFALLWDRLPALDDLIVGAVPGGVGATCSIAVVIGGLFLIYHGYLRWQLVVGFLLAAALTAAIAPLRIGGPDWTQPAWHWLPGLQFYRGMPVGPAYVVYHLLGGELLLAAFFFAGDMISRPITVRGQVLFALGCGVLTILIRLYLFAPGAPFVAVLLMNTLTPTLDRLTQPRAFGH